MFTGWMINDNVRDYLLAKFAPTYDNVRMSHITHLVDAVDIPVDADIAIYAYVRDEHSEAVLVEVNGTRIRPDGKKYHITISFPDGGKASDTNDTILNATHLYIDRFCFTGRGFVSKGDQYITTPLTSI